MSKTVIICGAGVDKSPGLDFPLATELVPQIRQYLQTDEGKEIDKVLRKILPGLRFSYDKFIKNAIDKLSNEFRGQVATIVENISREIEKEETVEDDKKLGKLINSASMTDCRSKKLTTSPGTLFPMKMNQPYFSFTGRSAFPMTRSAT